MESAPFNLEKDISFLNNGFHNLKVKACDDASNCQSKSLEFNLNLVNNSGGKELSVSIIEPSNGLALSNIDFPINIRLSVTNPTSANKIDLFYKPENGEPILINTFQPVAGNFLTFSWTQAPLSGTYKIYAEADTWTKEIIKTNEIIISVNNINKEPPTTE